MTVSAATTASAPSAMQNVRHAMQNAQSKNSSNPLWLIILQVQAISQIL